MKRKSRSGQRRDASTSQPLNVATLQRRDVSAISPSQSLKEKRDQNSRVSKNDKGTKSRSAATQIREKRPTFVFSSFLIRLMMFYRLNTCVITSSMF